MASLELDIDLDEIFVDLPTNPNAALVLIEDRLRNRIKKSPSATKDKIAALSVRIIERWCQENGLDFDPIDSGDVPYVLSRYSNRIEKFHIDYLEEVASEKIQAAAQGNLLSFGAARLDPTEKEDIHRHLSRIRDIIENSDILDNKKNALLKKLNELAQEVDRTGTRTDGFFGLLGDLGVRLGQFGKDAKPLTDEIKSVLRIIMRSRARAEDVALPKSDEFPLLDRRESDPDA